MLPKLSTAILTGYHWICCDEMSVWCCSTVSKILFDARTIGFGNHVCPSPS